MTTETEEARIEAAAREDYETARKRVRGRPPWERLDPNCSYDMGMRRYAFKRAREILGLPPEAAP